MPDSFHVTLNAEKCKLKPNHRLKTISTRNKIFSKTHCIAELMQLCSQSAQNTQYNEQGKQLQMSAPLLY